MSWLLRLFESEFFNTWIAISYLFKYTSNVGVQFYLTQQLRTKFSVEEVEFFLPQLCHLLIYYEQKSMALELFLLDCCRLSNHFALQMLWNLDADVMDLESDPYSFAYLTCIRVREECLKIIADERSTVGGGGGSRNDDRKASFKVYNHIVPAVLGIGASWASAGSCVIASRMAEMALTQGKAPIVELPRRRSLRNSGGGDSTLAASWDNLASSKINTSSAPGGGGGVSDGQGRKNLFSRPRRAVSWTGGRGKLDSKASSSPSLEELHQGDAFSLSRFLVKTNSGKLESSPRPSSRPNGDVSRMMAQDSNSHYFHTQLSFVAVLNQITKRLLDLPKPARQSSLKAELALLNHNLPARVCIPLWCPATAENPYHHILCRIVVSEGVVLNSAEKVPYLLMVEVLETSKDSNQDEDDLYALKNAVEDLSEIDVSSTRNLLSRNSTNVSLTVSNQLPPINTNVPAHTLTKLLSPPPLKTDGTYDDFFPRMRTAAVMLAQLNQPDSDIKPFLKEQIKERILREMAVLEEKRVHSAISGQSAGEPAAEEPSQREGANAGVNGTDDTLQNQLMQSVREDPSASIFKENWAEKESRIRKSSPYGHLPNWRLLSVIVKTSSDLRQEQLACQLIREMKSIWEQEGVDAWVYYYRVLITSGDSGLIETIANSISIHSIKKDAHSRNLVPPGQSYNLRDYFIAEHGSADGERFKEAQRNFMKSLAGYSIVTYILAIKDRHNGNILLDKDGHIIHIDFGFILFNTPGNVGFESAPFKLSQEYVDVLGGMGSPLFLEWKARLKEAFVAVRKHADKIILLIEMMQKDSKFPCFGGTYETVVGGLRERFQLSMTEKQIDQFLERAILSSHNNMFSRLYDNFQYYSNGIL